MNEMTNEEQVRELQVELNEVRELLDQLRTKSDTLTAMATAHIKHVGDGIYCHACSRYVGTRTDDKHAHDCLAAFILNSDPDGMARRVSDVLSSAPATCAHGVSLDLHCAQCEGGPLP